MGLGSTPKIHCLVSAVRIKDTSKAIACLGQLQRFCNEMTITEVGFNMAISLPVQVEALRKDEIRKEFHADTTRRALQE